MAAKMSKKTRNLIIGAAFLLILIALLLVLLFGPGSKDAASSEESSSSEVSTTTVELIVSDSEHIKELSVENANGGYTIKRTKAGEDDLQYGIDALDGFDQNESEMEEIVNQFANLSATRLIEANAPDIAKYGLDDPLYIIRTIYDDGTEHEIRVGNTLTTGSGAYMMVDDDANVYAMGNTKMERLDYTSLNYLDLNVIDPWESYTDNDGNEVSAPTIDYLEVEGGTLEEPFRIEPMSEEQLASKSTSYGSTYRIVKPFEADMQYKTNTDGGDDNAVYTDNLQSLEAASAVLLNPTDEDLAAYGLEEPYCTISFSRDGTEHIWKVGNATTDADGNAAHYFYSSDREVIYIVDDSNLPWISIDIDDMYSSLMLLPYIDDVEKIELTVYDKSYVLTTDLKDEDEDDDDSNIVPYLDGEQVDLTAYRKMYQYFLAAPAETVYKGDKDAGTLVASFTYYYRDGGSDSVDLYDLGDRTCILSINGNKQWQTRISYVQHLATNIEKLKNGETPSLDY